MNSIINRRVVVRTIGAVGLVAVAAASAYAADDENSAGRRIRILGQIQTTSRVAFPGDPAYPARCAGAPASLIQGAGLTDRQGQFADVQSHCIGANGESLQGEFRFSGVDGSILFGRYTARLEPTVTSVFTNPPSGSWIVVGQVCFSGATCTEKSPTIAPPISAPRHPDSSTPRRVTPQSSSTIRRVSVGPKRR